MRANMKSILFFGLCFSSASISASLAGPCSSDIAELGKTLSQSSSLGPATTGALSGSAPGSIQPATEDGSTSTKGTTADKNVGGTAGTKEMNAVAGQVATSADDVRRQQQGLPTAAQAAAAASKNSVETAPAQTSNAMPDERMAKAKMELEKARTLDQQGDSACATSIKHTRELMGS